MNFRRLFFDSPHRPAYRWAGAVVVLFLFLIFSFFCWGIFASSAKNWRAVWNYREAFWNGWLLTVGISVQALILSLVFGLAAALARQSSFLPLRFGAAFYIECVRGLPLLVLIFITWYAIAAKWHIDQRMFVGVVTLSLFSGAYIAEIIRAGLESVGGSQRESARAIGLTTVQAYWYVIFPQALRHSLPPLAGQFASLIKDSSLLSVIAISEFTFVAQQVNSATVSALESFLPLGIGYLVLTVPLSLWTKFLETRLRFDT